MEVRRVVVLQVPAVAQLVTWGLGGRRSRMLGITPRGIVLGWPGLRGQVWVAGSVWWIGDRSRR
eukprot:13421624-Alexandrium_andersonii.AAC.1